MCVAGVFFEFGACVGADFVVKYRALETPPCVDGPEGRDNTLIPQNPGVSSFFCANPVTNAKIMLD
jgi:hypothetical protein